jgi:predicted hydrocarbon binding protein
MSLLTGLYKYKIAKKYSLTKTMNDRRRNMGRDYSKDLLKNSLSGHIQRSDMMSTFLGFVQDVFVESVKTVSRLRVFKAFSVNKDEWRVK